jgi:hypothetical protein
MSLSVAPELFWARLVRLRDEWAKARETEAFWHDADALSLAVGPSPDGEQQSTKSSALQIHLFGVEARASRAAFVSRALGQSVWGEDGAAVATSAHGAGGPSTHAAAPSARAAARARAAACALMCPARAPLRSGRPVSPAYQ